MKFCAQFVAAIVFASALIAHVHAELHRIVDENGNVTFSQFPPHERLADIERKTVDELQNHVQLRHGRYYCGDVYLVSATPADKDQKKFKEEILSQKSLWQKRLTTVEQRIRIITESQFQREASSTNSAGTHRPTQTAHDERIKRDLLRQSFDLQCAIEWSTGQQRSLFSE